MSRQEDTDAVVAKLVSDIESARRLVAALSGRAGLAQLAAAVGAELEHIREATRETYRGGYPKNEEG